MPGDPIPEPSQGAISRRCRRRCSVCGGRKDESGSTRCRVRRSGGASGTRMVDDGELQALFTHSWVSGREAVAMTVRSVRRRAIWTAIDPTPPAPPMMRIASAALGVRASPRPGGRTSPPRPSTSSAAAPPLPPRRATQVCDRQLGVDEMELRIGTGPCDRSGILDPSPNSNYSVTSGPTSRTIPAASHPSTFQSPSAGGVLLRTL